MRINEIDITKKKENGALVITDFTNKRRVLFCEGNEEEFMRLRDFYNRLCKASPDERAEMLDSAKNDMFADIEALINIRNNAPIEETPPEEKVATALGKMIDFFKEFEFVPNFRFVNSLAYSLIKSKTCATNYVTNYFRLIDSPYAKEVSSKVRSDEFMDILSTLTLIPPQKKINSRFKIYYGNAGTGKTTEAQKEADNRCIVCNNSMLPSDLMEDFIFDNGKPSFKPSALWECMTNGLPIVLDEINLLPFDSLRFLQGILDGKQTFTYKGHNVTIADGFAVIGTMNLVVNGATYNLPEPLVDRASEMKEFVLSPKQLMGALK